MQKIYKVAVVGGGASGLMTAVELVRGKFSLSGEDVVILERNDRVGKKLIATGNGQGNLTNANLSAQNYRGEKEFIHAFLQNEKNIDLCKYLEELGIPLCEQGGGKKYPLSRQASAVLDVIRAFLQEKGVETRVNSKVNDIKKNGKFFVLTTQDGQVFAEKVVLAFGGAVAKQFGTDGSAYSLAQSFGHKKTQLFPSLVQLKTKTDFIRGLKGLKETATVTLLVNGKQVCSSTGDLLFTDFGVSGSTVFQVSSGYSGQDNARLKIEFLPELSIEQVENILKNRKKLNYFDEQSLLLGVLNKRVGQAVIKYANSTDCEKVAKAIKNFNLEITGTLGFDYAQVTKGGIQTQQIDQNTFESKLQKGLYIVGEALDVDGDCGGYNLTFAFVSAIVTARGIKNFEN